MFCVKCGTETPDDSQFCRKCGHALGVVPTATVSQPAASVPPAKPKSKWSLGVFIVLLILILIVWWGATNHRHSGQLLVKLKHTVLINQPSIAVNANGYYFFKLEVPQGATGSHLQGTFTASGGNGNDIEAYLLSEADFENWKNGHAANTYYNSGKVTVGNISVNLPPDGTTFYLVFNNKFSLLSPKNVQVNAALTYHQ
jgi:hypothetical protein